MRCVPPENRPSIDSLPQRRYNMPVSPRRHIGTIFGVCERVHPLLASMKGFTRIDTGIHLYVKALQEGVALGDNPVYIDGMDL